MKKIFQVIILVMLLLGFSLSPSTSAFASDRLLNTVPDQDIQDPDPVHELDSLVDHWTEPELPTAPEPDLPQANPDQVIYLTFDDGPDPDWTPQILELLQRYHAIGTFYMIGRNARSFQETTLQVAQAGQMIGLHGYNHIDLSKLSYTDFYLEVADTATAIKEALAGHPELKAQLTPCLRPPYGAVSDSLYSNADSMNYAISMWHLDTRDWAGLDEQEIFDNAIKDLQPYKVVLMHDGGEDRTETVRGLELLLHELTLRGYVFLPYCIASGQEFTH